LGLLTPSNPPKKIISHKRGSGGQGEKEEEKAGAQPFEE